MRFCALLKFDFTFEFNALDIILLIRNINKLNTIC